MTSTINVGETVNLAMAMSRVM